MGEFRSGLVASELVALELVTLLQSISAKVGEEDMPAAASMDVRSESRWYL